MQIILSGQPQLAAKLARPSLAQLRQRIAILGRLEPFSAAETDQYIDHRLRVAGYEGGALFTSDARAIIAVRSRGIPRNINNLCFNALSLGYALGRKKIDGEIALEAVRDLDVEPLGRMGDVPQSAVPPAPPAEPRSAPRWVEHSGFGRRPFRTAALAASIVLASLLLFPSVRRLLGTHLDRFFSGSFVLLTKSHDLSRPTLPLTVSATTPPDKSAVVGGAAIGLSRPILPLTVSTTTPADKSAVVDGAASDTVPSGNPTVVVEVRPSQTLEQISVSHFGRFDKKLLQEIRALNPRITDPDHIETGQRIILPTRTLTSPGTDSAGRAEVEPMTSARN
jgi:hypothetical protein